LQGKERWHRRGNRPLSILIQGRRLSRIHASCPGSAVNHHNPATNDVDLAVERHDGMKLPFTSTTPHPVLVLSHSHRLLPTWSDSSPLSNNSHVNQGPSSKPAPATPCFITTTPRMNSKSWKFAKKYESSK